MQVTEVDSPTATRATARRSGYVIAILVNVAMLIVIPNLLDWGWPAFLTDEFEALVSLFVFSISVTILANIVYLAVDSRSVRSAGQIAVNLISLYVTYQIWRVFPFDFSNYSFDWAVVARVVLVLAMVGTGIGIVTEAVKLASVELGNERR